MTVKKILWSLKCNFFFFNKLRENIATPPGTVYMFYWLFRKTSIPRGLLKIPGN